MNILIFLNLSMVDVVKRLENRSLARASVRTVVID